MKTKIALLALALTAQPTLAQEVFPLVLEGREVMPDITACQTALEQGQILKTDETGALHISIADLYFVILVDEKEMTCRMFRHVYRS